MGHFSRSEQLETLKYNSYILNLLSDTNDTILFIIIASTYILAYTALEGDTGYSSGVSNIVDSKLRLIVHIRNTIVHYHGNSGTLINFVNNLHNLLNNIMYVEIHEYKDPTIQNILMYLKEHDFKGDIKRLFK